jgi:hypothetical protein
MYLGYLSFHFHDYFQSRCQRLFSTTLIVLIPLTHSGGGLPPIFFGRDAVKNVLKMKKYQKYQKISYYTETISALKLSSGVSSKNI